MAAKSTIESPVSSSEEEFSFQEDHQLMNRKRETESAVSSEGSSEDEESDCSEDSDPRPKSVSEGPAVNVKEKNVGLSENKEDAGLEYSNPKPKTVSKIPTVNIQEEDDDPSEEDDSDDDEDSDPNPKSVIEAERVQEEGEESDSEEEVSEQHEDFHDRKHVNKGNKESQTGMVPPSAGSVKIKTGGENSKSDLFKRIWSLEDEKTLLNSQLLFHAETGKIVGKSTMKAFCEFLTGKFGFTDKPGLRQVSQKIEALKRKYSRNRDFSKQHDLEMKKIAIQLWGSDANSKSSKRKFSLLDEEIRKLKTYTSGKKPNFQNNLEKAEALELKVKKQKILEMKEEMKRIDLNRVTFKLFLDEMED